MTYREGYEHERICANESNNSTWSPFLKEGRTTRIFGPIFFYGVVVGMYGMFKWVAEASDILFFFLYLSLLLFFSLFQAKRPRKKRPRKSVQNEYRSAFINEYAFPDSIKEQVRNHYPHLSDEHLRLVLQRLSQYFQFCYMSGKEEISMPSRVVDHAWHEFMLIT